MTNFKATDFLSTIITNIEALGYEFTNETFDFDSTPSSKIGKAYRFDMNTSGIEEYTGKCVDKTKQLGLWFCFSLKWSKDNVKNELIAAYDYQEIIEDELINSLVSVESMVIESLNSSFSEDHFIININFQFTYGRNLL